MGGGGGGGSVFRTVSRAAVTRTVAGGPPIQEPLSSSSSSSSAAANTTTTTSTSRHTQKPSSSHNLSLSSPTSPFASCNIPLASNCGTPGWPSSPRFDDFDWVTLDNGISSEDDERVSRGFLDDFVLGPVPSKDEVHSAVSALQQ
ncbi:flocculation protein FLO11-like [Pyrus communis]|uniref:flocculation protein FLO11-like n=1 Tax=Pyrus communis TaxID=23211 RepID=UPI0035BF92A9